MLKISIPLPHQLVTCGRILAASQVSAEDSDQDLLDAVRTGRIPLSAATRILTPLARINAAHALTLLAQLE